MADFRSRTLFLLLSAVLAIALHGRARADTIFLDNGTKIVGHILREDEDGGLVVERGATTFSLPSQRIKRAIKHMHRDASLVLLGDSFVEEQDYEMARYYYQRALMETSNKDVVQERIQVVNELIFRRKELAPADDAFRKGEYRTAADLYEALLVGKLSAPLTVLIRKKAAEAHTALAQQSLDANRNDDVLFDLSRAMKLDPMGAHVHALSGHLLLRLGKYQTAHDEFAIALERDRSDSSAMEGMELLGRDVDEFFRKLDAGGNRGLPKAEDMRGLNELLSEASFQGSQPGIDYAALSHRGAYLPEVKFDLQVINHSGSGAPGTGYAQANFRSSRMLSIFLQAYNAGPNAAALYDGHVPYKETVNYVKRVNTAVSQIQAGAMKQTPYDGLIKKYAERFGLPPVLIKAIVKVESDFNPKCVSSANARGLIQLVRVDWDDTMRRLNRNDDYNRLVHDPEWNLFVGCSYLRWLYDTCLPKMFGEEFS